MSKITDYPPGPGINGSEQVLIATPAGFASTNYTYTLATIKAYSIAGLGSVSLLNYPGGTSLFLRADGTFAAPPGAGAATWGGITGTLSAQTDLSNALALLAPLASPTLTGVPAAPTATGGTSTTQLATTAFVTTADNLKANLASPTFTGTPAAPTASPGTNTTQLATTAYADAIAALKANLASPTFTGTPASTTAAVDTNTTQIATTAFVVAQAASATPANNGTATVGTSLRYARGDHVHNSDATKANISGVTFTGLVTTLASATGTAGLNVPHGAAPTSPVNGDVWTTTAGLFARINGATVGPYAVAGLSNPMTTSQDIIVGGASGTPGRLAVGGNGTFLGVSAGAIAWTTPAGSGDFVGPGSSTSGNLVSFGSATGKLGADSGVLASSVVVGPASVTTGRVASYNGTTGKLIADGGILVADVVTGPASSVNNRVAFFSGTTGKVIADSGLTLSGTNTGDQTTVSGNAGTATTLQTSRNIDGQAFNGSADITVIAPGTHAATSKATPVSADELPLVDSAASNVLKRLTWANVLATLQATLANIASPTFTGTPAAPTAATGTSTTQLATTAFVQQEKLIPQNSKSAAYTTVLADGNGHLYHPSADTTARTFTIDSNANVAYPIGTTLSFVNDSSAGVLTISITSDTLVLAGAGTTGSRTLAANGIATAIKMTSTRWQINGTGLT